MDWLWAGRTTILAAFAWTIAACAGDAAAESAIVDEVKLGVLYHDIGVFGDNLEDGADVNAEILFAAPGWFYDANQPAWVNSLLAPRPHIGVSVNTEGDTSQFYFGLTWDADLFVDILQPGDGLFATFGAGGAVHDGKLDTNDPDRKSLGSRVLFHLSTEIGYRFSERFSLAAYLEHSSNANLADRNDGFDNLGLRLGIGF